MAGMVGVGTESASPCHPAVSPVVAKLFHGICDYTACGVRGRIWTCDSSLQVGLHKTPR